MHAFENNKSREIQESFVRALSDKVSHNVVAFVQMHCTHSTFT